MFNEMYVLRAIALRPNWQDHDTRATIQADIACAAFVRSMERPTALERRGGAYGFWHTLIRERFGAGSASAS